MTGLLLFGLIGFIALAIDIGNLLVARNELQNAADAAALAGAQVLYNDAGTLVNEGAIFWPTIRLSPTKARASGWIFPIIVSNSGDVQRGHWNLAERR